MLSVLAFDAQDMNRTAVKAGKQHSQLGLLREGITAGSTFRLLKSLEKAWQESPLLMLS